MNFVVQQIKLLVDHNKMVENNLNVLQIIADTMDSPFSANGVKGFILFDAELYFAFVQADLYWRQCAGGDMFPLIKVVEIKRQRKRVPNERLQRRHNVLFLLENRLSQLADRCK